MKLIQLCMLANKISIIMFIVYPQVMNITTGENYLIHVYIYSESYRFNANL